MPLRQLWLFGSRRRGDRRKSSPAERDQWEQNARHDRERHEQDELDKKLQLLAAEAAVYARKEL